MKNISLYKDKIFLTSAFFVILPNFLKEVAFVFLFLYSLYLVRHTQNFNLKLFLFFILFFNVSLFSLIYTDNIKYGLRRIEGYLPLLYLSFAYVVMLKSKFTKRFIRNWAICFNLSLVLFLILFVLYFHFSDLELSYNNIRTTLDTLPLISIHPIYLSIVCIMAVFSLTYFYKSNFKLAIFFIIVDIFEYSSFVMKSLP